MSELKKKIKVSEKELGIIIAKQCNTKAKTMAEMLIDIDIECPLDNAKFCTSVFNLYSAEALLSEKHDMVTVRRIVTYAIETMCETDVIPHFKRLYATVSLLLEDRLSGISEKDTPIKLSKIFVENVCGESSKYIDDSVVLFYIATEITSEFVAMVNILASYEVATYAPAPATNENTSNTRKLKPLLITLTIALVISIALNIIYVPTSLTYEKTMADYKLTIDKLKGARSSIIHERETLKSYEQDLDWYMSNAVLVTDEGSRYHKSCCQYVDGRSFYIYNVENAKAQGYSKCKVCFSNNYDWRDYI